MGKPFEIKHQIRPGGVGCRTEEPHEQAGAFEEKQGFFLVVIIIYLQTPSRAGSDGAPAI